MNAWQRFQRIMKNEFILPVDDTLHVDIPAYAVDGGHAMMVSCQFKKAPSVVADFAERESGMMGWMITIGFPEFIDGRYKWVLRK